MSSDDSENVTEDENTLLNEYCEASTIHGVRYFGETYRPKMERIFWTIIFVISFILCAKLTYQVYDNWQYHPVIISFEDKSTAIGSIPFPAVTICPNNRYNKRDYNFSFFEFVEMLEKKRNNFSENEKNILNKDGEIVDALALFCMPKIVTNLKGPDLKFPTTNSIVRSLNKYFTTFNETFEKCLWKDKPENCRNLFSKSLTGTGICYTFNYLGCENILRKEIIHPDYVLENVTSDLNINWNQEKGYTNLKYNQTNYPLNVLSAGFEVGLSMELIGSSQDIDNYCGGLVPGFTMVLHSPSELPQSLGNFVRIPFDQDTLVAIKPNMKTTSKELKSYSPHKRQCYFSDERYLRFFKMYTQNNCELECLANYTLNKCDCISFDLPRPADAPVCTLDNFSCVQDASKTMTISEAEGGNCDCLAGCTSINYEMEVSQAEIVNKKNASESYLDLFGTVTLFFKEDQFWTSKRKELYTVVDIVANIGGVLGLFMGVSIISVIEIVYYLLIYFCRRYCKSKKD